MGVDEYTRRVLAARRVHLALDAQTMRDLDILLDQASREIARGLLNLPETDRRAIARRIVQRVYADLERRLSLLASDGVRVQFTEIKSILDDATYQEIRRIPGVSARLVFQPRPPLQAAAAFLARPGTAESFLTLAVDVQDAARGVDAVIGEALVKQWSPELLARRIRPFIRGRSAFTAEELHDLRRIPASKREAARQLQYKTRRIAITEMGNAAHEAQVQAMIEAPQVESARWRLSPVRGTQQDKPDECDILAGQDLYGIGRGIFPLNRVPVRPHPNDRCWLQSVTRAPGRWREAKPQPKLVNRPTNEGLEGLTPAAQEAAILSATRAIYAGIQGDRQRRSEMRARAAA